MKDETEKTGTMLLSLLASVATSLKLDPKKVAKVFCTHEGDKKWLMEFTLECTRLKMEEISKKK